MSQAQEEFLNFLADKIILEPSLELKFTKLLDNLVREAVKQQLTLTDVVDTSFIDFPPYPCNCPDKYWVYDESGEDMYCIKCPK